MAKTANTPVLSAELAELLAAFFAAPTTAPKKAAPTTPAATTPKVKATTRKAPAATGIAKLDALSAAQHAENRAAAETRAARSEANKAAHKAAQEARKAALAAEKAAGPVSSRQVTTLLSLARQLARLGKTTEAEFLADVVEGKDDLTYGDVSPFIAEAISLVNEVKAAK